LARIGLAAAFVLAAAGCLSARPTPSPVLASGAASADIRLPAESPDPGWDVVDRAAAEGLRRAAEGVLAGTDDLGPAWRVYALELPDGTPGRIEARREAGRVRLTVRLGRFGPPDRAAAIAAAIEDALTRR
jgi:hypothetical protein